MGSSPQPRGWPPPHDDHRPPKKPKKPKPRPTGPAIKAADRGVAKLKKELADG